MNVQFINSDVVQNIFIGFVIYFIIFQAKGQETCSRGCSFGAASSWMFSQWFFFFFDKDV